MKQSFRYIMSSILMTTLLAWSGCTKFLDKTPVDVITEDAILGDKAAFITHMAYLYGTMPFENFSKNIWLSYYTDEMSTISVDAKTNMEYPFQSWKSSYVLIRALNNMIEKVPSSTIFTETEKTETLGELRFMRAYVYFSLVQRYGGVPLVTKMSELPADPSELYQVRDKAEDVYNFIETEMEASINMMSENASVYRFNKWSGLAYKSNAMLYAASIANYHEIQLDGLIGIPKSEAKHYWESASAAAKLLIETGPYKLYNEQPDKVTNYNRLFFDESTTNKERIFVNAFNYPINGHDFDLVTAPYSHRGQGFGGRYDPTFDMVEDYEYINDRDGTLKMANPDGSLIEYGNPADLFKDKDPRFLATVLYPGAPWKGTTIEMYMFMIKNGIEISESGRDGLNKPECTSTSFNLVKWADPTLTRAVDKGSSDVDKMLMRYAEVLLNYAEAQLELGIEPEARKYINMIRERAGVQALTGPVTIDDCRHERKIELAYEGNCYWDYKRWRIFHVVMFNKGTAALWPTYNFDKNIYIFRKQQLPTDKYTRTFDVMLYYSKLDPGVIASNPLLIENPGW